MADTRESNVSTYTNQSGYSDFKQESVGEHTTPGDLHHTPVFGNERAHLQGAAGGPVPPHVGGHLRVEDPTPTAPLTSSPPCPNSRGGDDDSADRSEIATRTEVGSALGAEGTLDADVALPPQSVPVEAISTGLGLPTTEEGSFDNATFLANASTRVSLVSAGSCTPQCHGSSNTAVPQEVVRSLVAEELSPIREGMASAMATCEENMMIMQSRMVNHLESQFGARFGGLGAELGERLQEGITEIAANMAQTFDEFKGEVRSSIAMETRQIRESLPDPAGARFAEEGGEGWGRPSFEPAPVAGSDAGARRAPDWIPVLPSAGCRPRAEEDTPVPPPRGDGARPACDSARPMPTPTTYGGAAPCASGRGAGPPGSAAPGAVPVFAASGAPSGFTASSGPGFHSATGAPTTTSGGSTGGVGPGPFGTSGGGSGGFFTGVGGGGFTPCGGGSGLGSAPPKPLPSGATEDWSFDVFVPGRADYVAAVAPGKDPRYFEEFVRLRAPWAFSSSATSLHDSVYKPRINEIYHSAVRLTSDLPVHKSEQKTLRAALGPGSLLRALHDSMTVFGYGAARKGFCKILVACACVETSKFEADMVVAAHLLDSLSHFNDVGKLGGRTFVKLSRMHDTITQRYTAKDGDGPADPEVIMEYIDSDFASTSSTMACDLESELRKVTLSSGLRPSALLDKYIFLYSAAEPDRSPAKRWESVQGRLRVLFREAAVGQAGEWLIPFADFVRSPGADEMSSAKWIKQFKTLESRTEVRAGMEAAMSLAAKTPRGEERRKAGADTAGRKSDDALVAAVGGLTKILQGQGGGLTSGGASVGASAGASNGSGGAMGSASTLIAALPTASEWTTAHGVPGQLTHFESGRPQLWTARNMKRMGMTVPDNLATMCPKNKLLGSDCPVCNAEGERPIKGWYISERSPQYNGVPRPKGAERAGTAWMHTLGYCPKIREKTHRWVRDHPEDMELFDPLPDGQDPGALP